ncbi:MAG: hypothetical protein AAB729_04560 [Patescibacteria group bacterium]
MNRNVEAGPLAVSDKYSLAFEVGHEFLRQLEQGYQSPEQLERTLGAFEIMREELKARRPE